MLLPQLVHSTLQIFSELIRKPKAQIKSMLSFLYDLSFFPPAREELSLLITLNVQGCRVQFLDLTEIGIGPGSETAFQPCVPKFRGPSLGGAMPLD